ncbi:MAG TPA: response regulator [Phycisphaerae bacterium]|nr:response regulator [Phycisphaerae bacterium]
MRDVFRFAAQAVPILMVDDDPDCRQLIRDAIEEASRGPVAPRVYEVSTGEEALLFLRREGKYGDAPRPGLVLMDIEMPGMGGQEALRTIRRDRRFADMAIVMMTGVTDDEQKRLAMANGANSYTNKPTDAERFMRTVACTADYWLRIHQYPKGVPVSGAA